MSKIINNFQGRENAIIFKSASGGINSNSIDNSNYAKYIQNMVLDDDNNLSVRYGTKIVAEYDVDPNKIFNEQLKLMEYINFVGKSEILIYQTYFTKIPNITQNLVTRTIIANNITQLAINIRDLNVNQKSILKKYLFEEVNIYIEQQTYSDIAEIFDVEETDNDILFKINLDNTFFDEVFTLWVERAGVYKFIDTAIIDKPQALILDLNPNVIVSYLNYQNYLIICNGVEPVLYYNGNTLQELKADYQIDSNSITKISDNQLKILVTLQYEVELRENLVINKVVSIANDLGLKNLNTITNINFTTNQNALEVNITFANNFINNPQRIFYDKSIPYFSYINVINDRLFALDSGGSYYNKYRSPDKSMLVYYCSTRKSIFNWYSTSGIIGQINLSSNCNKIDDLQFFHTYQGRICFWGKEGVQIWTGTDPTVINDGQNIDFGDFRWQKTEHIGIVNRNMVVELPNVFIFLSRFGICSMQIDGFNNLVINLSFAQPVNNYIKKQLENLKTEREYRALTSFIYPYGGFVGFRFIHNCYIYQLKDQGFWTIFTQNFTTTKSFLYDSVSRNLYLSYKNKTLVYSDKITNKNYMDMEANPIPFNLTYNWLNMPSTWYNENVYLGCKSSEPITINFILYINFDMSNYKITEVKVNQINSNYDFSRFDIDEFSNNEEAIYPQETLRFKAESLLIKITGITYSEFTFDSLYLAGGIGKTDDN